MKRTHLSFDQYFEVVLETETAQAAEMTLEPGRVVGGPDNVHPDSDQWLFLARGTCRVTIDGEENRLQAGDLVCIEAGEGHELENIGDEPVETVNLYVPPRDE